MLKNNRGFTLVELMVAAGMAGLVGLVAYSTLKTSSDVGTKTMIGSEVSYLKNLVISTMSDPIACENTFGGRTVALNTAVELKDKYNKTILIAGQDIGTTVTKNLLKVTRIKSVAAANSRNNLIVTVEYDLSSKAANAKKIKNAFDVNVFINRNTAGTQIANCMVDTAQLLKDAVLAACQMNESNGAVRYEAPPAVPAAGEPYPYGKCTHQIKIIKSGIATEIRTTGGPFACADGEYLSEVKTPNATDPTNKGITQYECKKMTLSTTCPANSYLRGISNTGVSDCVPLGDTIPSSIANGRAIMATTSGYVGVSLSCPNANEVVRYVDASGVHCTPKVITHTCPAGYFISNVNASGGVTCAKAPQGTACGANQYVQSISASGAVTCAPVTLSGSCSSGAINAVNSSGVITACAN